MANILNADNGAVSGSAGIKLSSDTSGVLNIQTNGATAISISSSQVVSFPATSGISFGGQITFAAGTAAAPSISVTGDTNTGIFFPAADTIAFSEGGVEAARFDSNGRLNLVNNPIFNAGTANGVVYLNGSKSATSGSALTFSGSSSYPTFKVVGTQEPSLYLEFGIGYAQWYNSYGNIGLNAFLSGEGKSLNSQVIYFEGYNNTADASLQLFDGKVYILGNGNVGIGTSSPGVKFTAQASSASEIDIARFRVLNGASGVFLDIGGDEPNRLITFDATGAAACSYVFRSGGTERMRLNTSGNLGIGTNNPAYRLDVVIGGGDTYNGRFRNSSTSTNDYNTTLWNQGAAGSATGYVGTGGSTVGNAAFQNTFVVGTQSSNPLVFATADAERARIDTSGNFSLVNNGTSFQWTNSGNNVAINGSSGVLSFYTGTTSYAERFRITGAGNVGIGTTTPGSYRTYISSSVQGLFVQSGAGGYTSLGFTGDSGTTNASFTTFGGAIYIGSLNAGGTGSNAELVIEPSTTTRARITSGGNFNIPTAGATLNLGLAASPVGSLVGSLNFLGYTTGYGAGIRSYIPSDAPGIDYQDLRFYTAAGPSAANTERARITAAGDVIVNGTTVLQSAKLSVHSGSIAAENNGVDGTYENAFIGVYGANNNEHNVIQTAVSSSGTLSGFRFRASNGGGSSATTTVLDLTRWQTVFYTDGSERMRITSAGRVGIGTSSPSYNFQVQKTSLAAPAIMIGGAFYGGPRLQVYGLDADANGWMGLGTDMAGNPYEHSIYFPDTGSNGILTFGTYNGTTYTTRMSLTRTGNLNVTGALSKGSGSFRIPHPLKEETHDLVHSFIEGPQADLIYSGKVQLEDGVATVNIDAASGMTEGTFVVLCRDIRCFTNNETDWDNVRGKVVGNLLTIECQNSDSNAVISWMVIGERQDKHMYDTDWTDENGKVIVEPARPVIKKGYN